MPASYEAVIGLEVHVQLDTASKLFCTCAVDPGAPANTCVCPVCLGHPGVLPVPNRRAVELAVRLSLALGATVHPRSVFARKNYFYPDLPKGYQISQYDAPLATGGHITIDVDGERRDIPVRRLHLEEDAGKSKHDAAGAGTLVDFNRVGTPLVEIVSEPALGSPREAHAYMSALHQLVEYLAVSKGQMEDGNLRCDANLSLRPVGAEALGVKTEIKNLNSFRFVERGLTHELERQRELLTAGGEVEQATLLWDERTGRTTLMRTKEEENDYRYFPEPDLPALVIDDDWAAEMRRAMPELPSAKHARFVAEYGLRPMDADVLTASRPLADYYEEVARVSGDPVLASNWVQSELLRVLKETGTAPAASPVPAAGLGELVKAIASGDLSGKMAKTVFEAMLGTGKGARAIIDERGLSKISDPDAIGALVDETLADNPDTVASILAGKDKLVNFLFGQVMKRSGGRVDPALGQKILRQRIEARREG